LQRSSHCYKFNIHKRNTERDEKMDRLERVKPDVPLGGRVWLKCQRRRQAQKQGFMARENER
jgi:hypothetical protein